MVTLVIKNPSRPEGFNLENVPVTASLAEVQDLIAKYYPGHPPASEQTLIYAGKVLKDSRVTIEQLVAKLEPLGNGPYNLHLVIKQSIGSTSTAPAQASSPPPRAQPSTTPVPAAAAAPAPAPPPATPTPSATPTMQGAQEWALPTMQEQAGPSSPFSSPWGGLPPYMYLNPIVATAYQVAYAAALAAGACVQQQQQEASASDSGPTTPSEAQDQASGSTAPPLQGLSPAAAGAAAAMTALRPMSPWPMHSLAYTQAYLASINSMAALTTQGAAAPSQDPLQQHQRIVQLLMGSPGLMQYPPQFMFAQQQSQQQQLMNQQQLLSMLLQQQGLPASITLSANGELANLVLGAQPGANNAGVRNRRNAAAAAMVQAAAAQRPHRPRRQRVFTLRVNMRTLLQLLVFGMVLYQHFTWRRFVMLVVIALALWVTSLAPLRRFVANLQAPPVRPPGPQPPVNPAAPAEAGGAAPAAPGADGAPQPAAPGTNPAQPVNRGIFGEIVVVLVGFMTSLLPAWNYNPEDAAAFAAAQDGVPAAAPQQQQRAAEPNQEGAAAAAAEHPPDQAAAAAAPHAHQD